LGLVVTIGGPHGTGKSTYAKIIAKELGLRYASAGQFFRDIAKERGISLEELSNQAAKSPQIDNLIDERSAAEATKGNVVIEGQLAAWMAKHRAQIRIYMKAPDEVRIRRIAHRDRVDYENARRETTERERIQRNRYKRYYGIDVDDMSAYNLVIDTGNRTIESTSAELLSRIKQILDQDRQA